MSNPNPIYNVNRSILRFLLTILKTSDSALGKICTQEKFHKQDNFSFLWNLDIFEGICLVTFFHDYPVFLVFTSGLPINQISKMTMSLPLPRANLFYCAVSFASLKKVYLTAFPILSQ